MLHQALGDEVGGYEISGGSEGLQSRCGLAAHGGDLHPRRPVGQAATPAGQPLLHRLHPVAAGEHQPVELVELRQGVIERPPVIRGTDHQGWQIHHRCSRRLEQLAGGAQLLVGPRDGDGAAAQGGGVGHRGGGGG